jgi:branched-chain amino acid transport system permease protein
MTAVTRWRRLSALRLRQLALPFLLRLAGLLLLAGGAVLLIETLYRRAAGI